MYGKQLGNLGLLQLFERVDQGYRVSTVDIDDTSPHFSYAPLAGDNQGHPAAPSHRQVQNRHTHINRNAFD